MSRCFASCIYLILIFFFSCTNRNTLFQQLSSQKTGIHFNNRIVENDTLNPIDVTNLYNGGGVGVGDFNNDGRPDLYFTGNLVSNKLYLNKGNMHFEDVTEEAKATGEGMWSRGVAVIDINNDGLMDIYVCTTLLPDSNKRKNLLYVNQGIDKNGIPHFKEMAKEYGLADTTHSTMAAFFDYDNDGDLDMFLVVNEVLKWDNPSSFRAKITNGTHPSTGRLYRNDWNESLHHGVYTDVSKQAGTTIEGYGHSVNIADINKDGWKDIYVSNDFNSSDLLYINNHDGTFSDKSSFYFKHTSANGMGQDIMDINNDGLADVVELDMSPEDNYRKKMMMNGNSYQTYQNYDYYGYQYQYVRNTLQLNQGPRITGKDSIGDPIFSDIGYLAGISETDWSWTPLVQDFDNDGYRDIIVTNGFPKDVTDHDFTLFQQHSLSIASKEYTLEQIPEVKLHNYAFHNSGNLTFTNSTEDWGLTSPTFSNGAVYVDLDGDGDLDMVINNINDEASVYENTLRDDKGKDKGNDHFLNVKLKGEGGNINALGTFVQIYYDHGKTQMYEETPYRGYLSTVPLDIHFGLGNASDIDSMVIKWPNGKEQVFQNVQTDQTIKADIHQAALSYSWTMPVVDSSAMLENITDSLGIRYVHEQPDYIDFNIQKLLPHKFSEYGPAMAVGDIDGNGEEDMVIGGNYTQPTSFLLQQKDGHFTQKELSLEKQDSLLHFQDLGITLFDADGDGDLDLYVARGGYENEPNSASYQDRLYLNDGKGNFTLSTTALPENHSSKSCVRVMDYDHDGRPDLFVASRVDPWNYPLPVSSHIYHNDSQGGVVKFTDVTQKVAPGLINIGLVCDALWTDFDGDGWQDLIVAGEWMPVRFFKNDKGVLKDISSSSGINDKLGWWTSITSGDFDGDGKMDYVAGNLGLNSFYRASDKYPVHIYAKDFDGNGSLDAVPTIYLPASQSDTVKKEFPVHTKDDITRQLVEFRKRFPTYKSYARATFKEMFSPEQLKGALVLKANYLANSYIKNLGGGRFEIRPLPMQAQFACLNGMAAEDLDGDGKLDLLACGNDYGTEPSVGRYDACNGTLLKGDGKGSFTPMPMLKSGWYVPGNSKALVKLKGANGKTLFAVSQNKGRLAIFQWKLKTQTIPLKPNEVSAVLRLKNGKTEYCEFSNGSSFLSQSGSFLNINDQIVSVEIKDVNGSVRKVQP